MFLTSVNVVGYDTSVGYSQWAHKPATKNADVWLEITHDSISFLTAACIFIDCWPAFEGRGYHLCQDKHSANDVCLRML